MKPHVLHLRLIFRVCLLVFISFVWDLDSFAQDFSYGQSADSKFNDRFVDSCLEYYTREDTKRLGAESYVYENFYDENRDEIQEAIRSSLSKEFQKIDKAFSKSTLSGEKRDRNKSRLYADAIQSIVLTALKRNTTLYEKIKSKDENDRVVRFHQDIEILEDGRIIVQEQIIAFNSISGIGNDLVKRGIVRDFPTMYYNKYGIRKEVSFRIKSLTRNGVPEPYHTENLDNGIRIFAGTANQFLDEGIHRYMLTYETNHQLVRHEKKDEFYWNVNGNGWAFTMDKVSCKVKFPVGSIINEMACYTGLYGAKDRNCKYEKLNSSSISFSTNKRLMQYEGLTISVAVDKGVFEEESFLESIKKLVLDNLFLFVPYLVLIGMLLIYILSWIRYGRDPKRGVIMPRFEPNPSLSPVDMGYAYSQKFEPTLFSAAVIDMAVKNCLDISIGETGLIFKSPTYTFRKKNEHLKVHTTFSKVYNFDADDLQGQTIEKGTYNKKIASVYSSLERHVKARVEQQGKSKSTLGIFSRNDNYIGLGIFLTVMLLIFCAVGLGLYKPPFRFIVHSAIVLLAIILVQILFTKWMRAYTTSGRKLMDEIEGFRMYLNATERHVYDTMNPPEENLQLFEKYLPYAVALGVENRWSDRFKDQFTLSEEASSKTSFIRSNFSSSSFSSSFANSFSAGMASTVVSASTPPSSSTGGSSGSGFSGGGGGGGGGGGW